MNYNCTLSEDKSIFSCRLEEHFYDESQQEETIENFYEEAQYDETQYEEAQYEETIENFYEEAHTQKFQVYKPSKPYTTDQSLSDVFFFHTNIKELNNYNGITHINLNYDVTESVDNIKYLLWSPETQSIDGGFTLRPDKTFHEYTDISLVQNILNEIANKDSYATTHIILYNAMVGDKIYGDLIYDIATSKFVDENNNLLSLPNTQIYSSTFAPGNFI